MQSGWNDAERKVADWARSFNGARLCSRVGTSVLGGTGESLLASTEPDFAVGLEHATDNRLSDLKRASTEPDFAVGLELLGHCLVTHSDLLQRSPTLQSGWNPNPAPRARNAPASTEPDFAVGLEQAEAKRLRRASKASTEPDFAVGLEPEGRWQGHGKGAASTEPDFAVGLEQSMPSRFRLPPRLQRSPTLQSGWNFVTSRVG